MKNIWMRKALSFEDAEEFDREYYRRHKTSAQRLDIVQFCRQQYYKLKGITEDEAGKGLRKIIRVIKQA